MRSLRQKLELVHGMVGTKDLTDKETVFVENCWEFSKKGECTSFLTSKMVSWLDDLHDKHFA
jgi:hypothetical protein